MLKIAARSGTHLVLYELYNLDMTVTHPKLIYEQHLLEKKKSFSREVRDDWCTAMDDGSNVRSREREREV